VSSGQEESGLVTHSGGCHCGRVRFEVTAPKDLQVSDCNCSICSKSGFLHLIVPKSRFKLLSGAQTLTTYTFNTGTAQHLFCSVCGVKSFYVPRSFPQGYSVNARCLNEGTIANVTVVSFDGKDWERHFAQGRGKPKED
jgi:centromere protein V